MFTKKSASIIGNQLVNFNQLAEQIDRLVEIQLEFDNFTESYVKNFGALVCLIKCLCYRTSINHLTPRRTQVSPFTEISILFNSSKKIL